MERLDDFDGTLEATSSVMVEEAPYEKNVSGLLRRIFQIKYANAYLQTNCSPDPQKDLAGKMIGRWRIISRNNTISPLNVTTLTCDQYDDPDKNMPHCNITNKICPKIAIAGRFKKLVADEINTIK